MRSIIESIYNRAVEVGADPNMTPTEVKYVRLVNIWIYVPLCISPFYLITSFQYEAYYVFISTLIVSAVTLCCLFANMKQHFTFSRITIITIWNLHYMFSSIVLGEEFNIHYFIFTCAGVAINYSPKNETGIMAFLVAESLVIYIITITAHQFVAPYYVYGPGVITFISTAVEFSVFAVIILFTVMGRSGSISAESENEERFMELADLLPETICETDENGDLVFLNQTGRKKFGITEKDIKQGIKGFEIIVSEDRERARANFEKVMRGEDIGGREYGALSKDGKVIYVMIYTNSRYHVGKPVRMRAIIIDITERKQLEQELLNARKLESVGILAGGIAHDFNNILSIIAGNISLAKLEGDLGSEARELLDTAEKAAYRGRSLTSQFLTFSKGGAPVKKSANLKDLIKESGTFALRGSNSVLEHSISDGLLFVEVDQAQINRVISNLIINADQAMPEGGKIKVSANNTEIKTGSPLKLLPGAYLKIEIQDEGHGISPQNLKKIFDPYFTTKETGDGLGLATCHSIINKHNGRIEARSEEGSGATFTIYLPATNETPKDEPDAEKELVKGQGRILIMDDEPLALQMCSRMMEHMGYEPQTALNGEEAIKLYTEAMGEGRPFDVVIMDLIVPGGMGGRTCIKKLLEIDPCVTAIVASGFSDNKVLAQHKKYGFKAVVAKPFKIEDLSEILHELTGGETNEVSPEEEA